MFSIEPPSGAGALLVSSGSPSLLITSCRLSPFWTPELASGEIFPPRVPRSTKAMQPLRSVSATRSADADFMPIMFPPATCLTCRADRAHPSCPGGDRSPPRTRETVRKVPSALCWGLDHHRVEDEELAALDELAERLPELEPGLPRDPDHVLEGLPPIDEREHLGDRPGSDRLQLRVR